MTIEITDWEESLAKHAITLAFEGNALETSVDGDIDWSCSVEDWTIEAFDLDDDEAVVHATHETFVSERVSLGTRMEPPEYRKHDVELHMMVRFDPDGNDGFGHAEGIIEMEGGLRGPEYEYDPMEHK